MKLIIGKRYAATLLDGSIIKYTLLDYKEKDGCFFYIGKTNVLISSITYLNLEENKTFLFAHGSLIHKTSREIKQNHPLTGIFK